MTAREGSPPESSGESRVVCSAPVEHHIAVSKDGGNFLYHDWQLPRYTVSGEKYILLPALKGHVYIFASVCLG